jgi:hypothetical protein
MTIIEETLMTTNVSAALVEEIIGSLEKEKLVSF